MMDQRTKVLVIGALAGAAMGVIAAMMLQRRAERAGTDITLTTGEGVQLGMLALGLIRAVAGLADKEDNR
jgi:hypothetical protein